MAKTLPLYRASTGLNVAVDPARVKYDPQNGLVDLQACWNVELDASGRISRRKGYTLLQSGSFHSLFSAGDYAIAVKDSNLVWVDKVGTSGTITSLTFYNNTMSYAQVANRVYYSNGGENGYVENKVGSTWSAGTYVGRDSTKTISGPPAGQLLEIAFGRMWIAYSNVVCYSEPFAYNYYDLARCVIPLQGRISLLKAVVNGLYISDPSGVYFISGSNPDQMTPVRVCTSPAVEGAVAQELVNGLDYGARFNHQYCVFVTKEGLCLGGPDGDFINLTHKKVEYPNVNKGSVVVRKDNVLILLQE